IPSNTVPRPGPGPRADLHASDDMPAGRWSLGSAALLVLLSSLAVWRRSESQGLRPPRLSTTDPVWLLIVGGHSAEAVERARSSLREAERMHGADSTEATAAVDLLVSALGSTEDRSVLREGCHLAERSVTAAQRRYGTDSLQTAQALSGYAEML